MTHEDFHAEFMVSGDQHMLNATHRETRMNYSVTRTERGTVAVSYLQTRPDQKYKRFDDPALEPRVIECPDSEWRHAVKRMHRERVRRLQ